MVFVFSGGYHPSHKRDSSTDPSKGASTAVEVKYPRSSESASQEATKSVMYGLMGIIVLVMIVFLFSERGNK